MDHVLASVLMDLLLGLLSRAVMLLSAGALLAGTWAGACWVGVERVAPLFIVYNTKVRVRFDALILFTELNILHNIFSHNKISVQVLKFSLW